MLKQRERNSAKLIRNIAYRNRQLPSVELILYDGGAEAKLVEEQQKAREQNCQPHQAVVLRREPENHDRDDPRWPAQ